MFQRFRAPAAASEEEEEEGFFWCHASSCASRGSMQMKLWLQAAACVQVHSAKCETSSAFAYWFGSSVKSAVLSCTGSGPGVKPAARSLTGSGLSVKPASGRSGNGSVGRRVLFFRNFRHFVKNILEKRYSVTNSPFLKKEF